MQNPTELAKALEKEFSEFAYIIKEPDLMTIPQLHAFLNRKALPKAILNAIVQRINYGLNYGLGNASDQGNVLLGVVNAAIRSGHPLNWDTLDHNRMTPLCLAMQAFAYWGPHGKVLETRLDTEFRDYPSIAIALANAGANVNAYIPGNQNAAHFAAYSARLVNVLGVLIEKGVDLTRTASTETPLTVAIQGNNGPGQILILKTIRLRVAEYQNTLPLPDTEADFTIYANKLRDFVYRFAFSAPELERSTYIESGAEYYPSWEATLTELTKRAKINHSATYNLLDREIIQPTLRDVFNKRAFFETFLFSDSTLLPRDVAEAISGFAYMDLTKTISTDAKPKSGDSDATLAGAAAAAAVVPANAHSRVAASTQANANAHMDTTVLATVPSTISFEDARVIRMVEMKVRHAITMGELKVRHEGDEVTRSLAGVQRNGNFKTAITSAYRIHSELVKSNTIGQYQSMDAATQQALWTMYEQQQRQPKNDKADPQNKPRPGSKDGTT